MLGHDYILAYISLSTSRGYAWLGDKKVKGGIPSISRKRGRTDPNITATKGYADGDHHKRPSWYNRYRVTEQ